MATPEFKQLKPISTAEAIRSILKDPKFKGDPGKDGNSIKGDPGVDGKSGTIQIGTIRTGPAGSDVHIENVGTIRDAVLNIIIPKGFDGKDGVSIKGDKGDPGDSASVRISKVQTGAPGSQASVKNVGTDQKVILEITIPKGFDGQKGESIKGDPGLAGSAATIKVGSTVTGDPGSQASVENVGTEQNAVLKFTIPKGEKGEIGKVPDHEVKNNKVRFQRPDSSWGPWLDVGSGGVNETVYYPAQDLNRISVNEDYEMKIDDQVIRVFGTTPVTIWLWPTPNNYKKILTIKNTSSAEVTVKHRPADNNLVNDQAEIKIRARAIGGQALGNSIDLFTEGGQFWVK